MKPKIYGLASLTKLVRPIAQKRTQRKTARNAEKKRMPAFERAVKGATREWNRLTPDQRNGLV